MALNFRSVLSISLLDGFNQIIGDTFTIMDYSSLVGQFANGFIFFDDGFAWDVSCGQIKSMLRSCPHLNRVRCSCSLLAWLRSLYTPTGKWRKRTSWRNVHLSRIHRGDILNEQGLAWYWFGSSLSLYPWFVHSIWYALPSSFVDERLGVFRPSVVLRQVPSCLTDVFYVVSQTDPGTKQVKSSLLKRGKEMHEPDRRYLNPSQIVFVETVGTNSKVAQLIAQAPH